MKRYIPAIAVLVFAVGCASERGGMGGMNRSSNVETGGASSTGSDRIGDVGPTPERALDWPTTPNRDFPGREGPGELDGLNPHVPY